MQAAADIGGDRARHVRMRGRGRSEIVDLVELAVDLDPIDVFDDDPQVAVANMAEVLLKPRPEVVHDRDLRSEHCRSRPTRCEPMKPQLTRHEFSTCDASVRSDLGTVG